MGPNELEWIKRRIEELKGSLTIFSRSREGAKELDELEEQLRLANEKWREYEIPAIVKTGHLEDVNPLYRPLK